MGTLLELKNRIARETLRSDLTTDIASAIGDAVAEYKGRRFAFNQAQSTFSTTAGTEYYGSGTIPTGIAQIDSIRITAGGRTTPIDPQPFALLEGISSVSSAQGRPRMWAWYAEQIRFYPVPDDAYTITVSFLQQIDQPAADGDSNCWTTEAEELIRQAAKKRLYFDLLKNPQAGAIAEQAEARQFRRLKREANQLDAGPLMACEI